MNLDDLIYENSWLQKPILVTGQMRSGTTLLRQLLDGLPQSYIYPTDPLFRVLFKRNYESSQHIAVDWLWNSKNHLSQPPKKYLSLKTNSESKSISVAETRRDVLTLELNGQLVEAKDNPDCFNVDMYNETLKLLLTSSDELDPQKVIWASVLAAQKAQGLSSDGIKQWLYKQPSTTKFSTSRFEDPNEIEDFLNSFPEGKVVYIVRDPRAIYRSREQHFLNRNRKKQTFKICVNDMLTVSASIQKPSELIAKYGENKILVVRYEDVVDSTAESMRLIAEFLEVPWIEQLTEPTLFGRSTSVNAASKGFDSSKVEKKRTDLWKKSLPLWKIAYLESILLRGQEFYPKTWGYINHLPMFTIKAYKKLIVDRYLKERFVALAMKKDKEPKKELCYQRLGQLIGKANTTSS